MSNELTVLILSHKRAGRVLTHRYVEGCLICIPESQRDDYLKYHPHKMLVTHPDSVIACPPKYDWCSKTFGDIFMLDDDSMGMFRVYREEGAKQPARIRAGRARELIERTAETARQFGAYLYGFGSHANPRVFQPGRPFRMGGYTPSGAVGLLKGHKLWFPKETLPVSDYWLCCLNAYYHRYAFFDLRFAFGFQETYLGEGGAQEFRRDGAEVEATHWLKKKFGDVIQVKKNNKVVTKKERNPSPRTIRLPYHV